MLIHAVQHHVPAGLEGLNGTGASNPLGRHVSTRCNYWSSRGPCPARVPDGLEHSEMRVQA